MATFFFFALVGRLTAIQTSIGAARFDEQSVRISVHARECDGDADYTVRHRSILRVRIEQSDDIGLRRRGRTDLPDDARKRDLVVAYADGKRYTSCG